MGKRRINIQQKNYTLDCMRGIACLFVVLIHCPLLGRAGEIVRGIGRFAVPFFVLISGYYWYKPDGEQRARGTRNALGNILKLTLLGVLFCVLANTAGSVVSGKPPFYWLTSAFDREMVWAFLIFNRAAFLSSVMYYLFAMIYTYVLVLWMDQYGLMRWGIWAAPVLLTMNIIYNTLLHAPWYCAGNWLFTCVPFFMIGYYLRTKGAGVVAVRQEIWVACFLAGIVLTLVEYHAFGDVFCGIGTVLLGIAVFVLCLKNPGLGQGHPRVVAWIRRMSVGVFLVHCTFRDILKNLLGKRLPEGSLMTLAVLAVSVLFVWAVCLIYDKLRKQRR